MKELQQAQQPQAFVLQQPNGKDIQVELKISEVADDTTAISSFVLSVMIALILGGLATWLAYWYGRKSFQLTEMSFKMVVEQIKSSEKLISDSNQKLIQAHNDLSHQEFTKRIEKERLELYRQHIVDFLDAGNSLSSFLQTRRMYLGNIQVEKIMHYNSIESNFHSDFLNLVNNLRLICLKTSFYLENGYENHQELVAALEEITTFLNSLIVDIYPTTNSLVHNIQRLNSLHMRVYIYLIDRYRKEILKVKAA